MKMNRFSEWATANQVPLSKLFPSLSFDGIAVPDMTINSNFFGKDTDHEDLHFAEQRLEAFQKLHPTSLLANGYLEQRAFYNTANYEREMDNKTEYRNVHLGTDFWVPPETPVHCLFDAQVVISNYNDIHKDYGGLIVLEHQVDFGSFYTLHGHLSKASIDATEIGAHFKKGDCFAYIGNENENGHWLPHLHFQIITDLLRNTTNYNGVAFPSEIELWKERCPNPDYLFTEFLPSAIHYER